MKSVLVLTLSFLPLFAFLSNLQIALSNNDIEQVLDTNGNPIFPGGTYYIIPAIRGPAGGGLKLDNTENTRCPLTVMQDYSEVFRGLPVKFNIPGISPGIIFTGTPLDIGFVLEEASCARSTKWLVYVDKIKEKAYVAIGGPEVHDPLERLINGTFNIQKYKFGYKLVFCVTDSPTCLDIGRFAKNGENGRRLILTHQEPFQVVFVDASDFGDGSIIKSIV